jgi:hypothetical protein
MGIKFGSDFKVYLRDFGSICDFLGDDFSDDLFYGHLE